MKKTVLYLLVLSLIINTKLFSQIVNMESQRYRTDTIGWSGSIHGDFALSDYGQKVIALNAASHVQYKSQKSLYLLLGSYGFLKGEEEFFTNNAFVHLRYNYKLNKWLRFEAFTQVQQNAITKIDSRFLAGAGPRFKLADNQKIHLYAGLLTMYESEKEAGGKGKLKNWRSSNYISLTFTPNPLSELTTTTYYQPLYINTGDYRLLNQTTYKIRAARLLSITVNWSYQFDAMPAVDVQKHTYGFSTGLQVDM